jgi:outer membrane lipase/esterase
VRIIGALVTVLACFVQSGVTRATPVYDRIVVFGDSLSDAGNVFHLTSTLPGYVPDPPPVLGSPAFPAYYMGRASNGPNWVDQLADKLGLPRATASLDGGTNYAYASARSGLGTNERYPSPTYPPNPRLKVLRTGSQIEAFAATDHFNPRDLVTLWVGANDFRDLVLGQTTIPTIVGNILQEVRQLNDLGARTIVVPNQVDLSLPPVFNTSPLAGLVHRDSLLFDASLASGLRGLISDPTIAARIVPVNEYSAMEKVFADPAAFGFTNVTDPAITFTPPQTFTIVPDVQDYFWFDIIHPTTKAQAIFAQAAYDALVPAPSSLSLLAPGVIFVAGLAAKRRRAGKPR